MRAPRWPLSKVASPCPGRSKGPKRSGQDRTRHRPSFCPGEEGRCRPAPLWCLQAYLKWAAEGGKDRQLPGLDMTYDQLFFINYAQVGAASPLPTCPHTGSPLASLEGLHRGVPRVASRAEPDMAGSWKGSWRRRWVGGGNLLASRPLPKTQQPETGGLLRA